MTSGRDPHHRDSSHADEAVRQQDRGPHPSSPDGHEHHGEKAGGSPLGHYRNPHERQPPHEDDRHAHGHEHDHSHGQDHHGGILGILFHSHGESSAFADPTVAGNERGIWAIKISLVGLMITALLQVIVYVFSGSVALLADTIHNFADALTSVPLWIAFVLGRRAANRRYTYGYGRAEDLAGVVIVLLIVASAALAGYESYRRFLDPVPLQYAGAVIAAALIGFVGNEIVARFKVKVGQEIGSAALIADGQHSRIDGLTSLSVMVGALGTLAGFPIADPIVGLVITIMILFVVRDAATRVWERLMDAVNPETVERIERTARRVPGVQGVHRVRVRWLGHRLQTDLMVMVDGDLSTAESHEIAERVRHELFHEIPRLAEIFVHIDPVDEHGVNYHAITAHHEGRPPR